MPGLNEAKNDDKRQVHQPLEIPVPLREVRRALNVSLRDLVALMPSRKDGSRWSEATVSRVENGQRGASPELISALAEALRQIWGNP